MSERPRGFGLSAEKKYDPLLEKGAIAWIYKLTREEPNNQTFQEFLKDGIVLTKLMNVIQPGTITKITSSKMAFKQMEQIGLFLEAITAYGVKKTDQFQTVDLYENANMAAVINCIHALGREYENKGGIGIGPVDN